MEYGNIKEVKEIDHAIDYVHSIREKFIYEIRQKEKEMPEGVINDVINRLASDIVDIENKIVDELKERLTKL